MTASRMVTPRSMAAMAQDENAQAKTSNAAARLIGIFLVFPAEIWLVSAGSVTLAWAPPR